MERTPCFGLGGLAWCAFLQDMGLRAAARIERKTHKMCVQARFVNLHENFYEASQYIPRAACHALVQSTRGLRTKP